MKLGSYIHEGKPGYGAQVPGGIFDLTRRLAADYPDLLALLRGGGLDAARKLAQAKVRISRKRMPSSRPTAPVNIFCAGVNYLDHIEEMGRERPPNPTLFMKLAQSLVGHNQPLIKPRLSECFDFEAELAVVIGKGGWHIQIQKENWRDHVAGYSCLMVGSIRDFQKLAVDQGKNFYHSSASGPWMVTLDEVPEPADMKIEGRLNGEIMQHSSIDMLIFGVAELVSYYSGIVQLEPGDMISTGTPAGVGHGRSPELYMKAGDVFEVEITGVGLLSNPVVDEWAVKEPAFQAGGILLD